MRDSRRMKQKIEAMMAMIPLDEKILKCLMDEDEQGNSCTIFELDGVLRLRPAKVSMTVATLRGKVVSNWPGWGLYRPKSTFDKDTGYTYDDEVFIAQYPDDLGAATAFVMEYVKIGLEARAEEIALQDSLTEEQRQRCKQYQSTGMMCDCHLGGNIGPDCGWMKP
jgi:hypothetical protein